MRYLAASALVFIYLLFCWFCWQKHRRQLQQQQVLAVPSSDDAVILIAYASQTGNAARIARQTAQQLNASGKNTQLITLNQLNVEQLTCIKQLLIIASTYGEGEAPDNGNRFVARTLESLSPTALSSLEYLVLGLGDSSYLHFCGFAQQLHNALHHCGAHAMADMISVDKLDESALRHWQYYLGQISGNSYFSDWSKPAYEEWRLIARECINPASPGAPAYHLQLQPTNGVVLTQPQSGAALWCAGDIVEIGPRNSSDLPHREYSIASVPSEGSLDLLVRQVRAPGGELGLGSGWLTAQTELNSIIHLRVRSNPHFHSPPAQVPLILIGNGTGIAGLRSHLANPARARGKHWLFFGERSHFADDFFSADIQHWLETGLLTRVNKVFSRDAASGETRYVQDLLPYHAEAIREWVAAGAAIYVCGSLQGMAQAVDEALVAILGAAQVEQLADQQRYCRDVY